jgi:hypothetical protein
MQNEEQNSRRLDGRRTKLKTDHHGQRGRNNQTHHCPPTIVIPNHDYLEYNRGGTNHLWENNTSHCQTNLRNPVRQAGQCAQPTLACGKNAKRLFHQHFSRNPSGRISPRRTLRRFHNRTPLNSENPHGLRPRLPRTPITHICPNERLLGIAPTQCSVVRRCHKCSWPLHSNQ